MRRSVNLCLSIGVGLLLFIAAVFTLPIEGFRVAIAAAIASIGVTLLLESTGLTGSLATSIITVIVGQTFCLSVSGRIALFPHYISKTGLIGLLMLLIPLIASVAGSLIASGLKNRFMTGRS